MFWFTLIVFPMFSSRRCASLNLKVAFPTDFFPWPKNPEIVTAPVNMWRGTMILASLSEHNNLQSNMSFFSFYSKNTFYFMWHMCNYNYVCVFCINNNGISNSGFSDLRINVKNPSVGFNVATLILRYYFWFCASQIPTTGAQWIYNSSNFWKLNFTILYKFMEIHGNSWKFMERS